MKRGDLAKFVLSAMGSRDQISIDELRSVVFAAYSEEELLRRGTYANGQKTGARAAYAAGDPISAPARAAIVSRGIGHVVRAIGRRGWIEVDTKAGVARRVRT